MEIFWRESVLVKKNLQSNHKVNNTSTTRNNTMSSENLIFIFIFIILISISSGNCVDRNRKKHYVLVHGACHGAWSWCKLKPRLESEGHKVTVLDLAASGINMKRIADVDTFSQYSEPLLQLMTTIP